MDYVTDERKSAGPEVHHSSEAFEAIPARERFFFIALKPNAINRDLEYVRRVRAKAAGSADQNIFHLHAWHAHNQLDTTRSQAHVKVQNVPRLIGVRAERSDRVSF
jgi:hypothetical protein